MGIKPKIAKVVRNASIAYAVAAVAALFIGVKTSMDPEELKILVFLALCAGAGIFLFFWGWEVYSKKTEIEDIPTSKIRSIPMGIVEIKGRALQKYPLASKLNGINCVYYEYKVEKLVSGGYGRNRRLRWKTVSKGASITPFFVEDDTDRVLVEPFSCESVLARRYHYSDGMFNGAKRYSEWYIQPGEEIFIMGFAGKSEDVMASRREKLRERLKELKGSKEEMKKYDLNNDGEIDGYEWGLAVDDIKREIARETSGDDLCDIAVSGSRKEQMIISDRSEKSVLKSLAVRSFLGIFGGLVAFALSAYAITVKFANIFAR